MVDSDGQPLTDQKDIDKALKTYKHADWYGDEYEEGEYIKGLVMTVNPSADQVGVRFGRYKAVIGPQNMGRSGKKPKDELKPGALAEFLVKKVNNESQTLDVELSQVPEIQAAMVTINSHNGEIACMVGGYDFHTNRFNNATQGLRQTGSAYKPFIYTAAVEDGMTPDMMISGAPIKKGSWQPHNYDGSLSNPNVPMRIALAKSLNVSAVHLLEQVGIQAGAQMVRRFGISNPMAPSLPSALGASEASLLEMTSAYSTFPNKGIRMTPHMIRKVYSRDGTLLEEWDNSSSKVTSEYVALTMVDMMRGVTGPGGTAAGVSAAGQPVAGKTGTVNDHTDVWFIGYTPTWVTGVWMGNPEKKENLGSYMTGGHGAMPYFNAFMDVFMKGKPKESFEQPPPIPADIKSLIARNKREELEKLEEADIAGQKTGVPFDSGPKPTPDPAFVTDVPPATNPSSEKPASEKPTNPRVVVEDPIKPVPTPKRVEKPAEPEPSKRKGKKGDG